MPAARNQDVVDFIEKIADMLEVRGENRFKIRAYREAARHLESLSEPLDEIIKRDELMDIPGIGESIAAKVKEFVETGNCAYYESLKTQIDPGVIEMLQVPGIGAKKAKLFAEALGISSVEELEQAAREHRLSSVPRIGAKTEQNILEAIERMHGRSKRTPLGVALPAADQFLEMVRSFEGVERADLAGSLRRMVEDIGDLDLLASSQDPPGVIDLFISLPAAKSVLVHGPTKGTIVTNDGLQIDLRAVKPEEYGAALQYFTGSKSHNIKVRELAVGKGLKVNEYGVFRVSDGERVAGETEEGVYAVLGMEWMPPELREGRGEVEASLERRLPRLIELSDIKGDLHTHTNWSDGSDSPEEIVQAAIGRGYEYVAISDHSVSMGFIRGLTLDRIAEQRAVIDELNRKYPDIRVLQGIEVNIRADGSLDYEDEVLERFDVVTASIHSAMTMPEAEMTARIIGAIENPNVDVIGHPTGRTIGKRDPYAIDLPAIVNAAVNTGTALEMNAHPMRLDLNHSDARFAKDRGVMLAINSDSHSKAELALIEYGIATARRGWVEAANVLNALPLEQLLRSIRGPGGAGRRKAA